MFFDFVIISVFDLFFPAASHDGEPHSRPTLALKQPASQMTRSIDNQ
jgi:hypothetical protein